MAEVGLILDGDKGLKVRDLKNLFCQQIVDKFNSDFGKLIP
jgi:hypothetical protein